MTAAHNATFVLAGDGAEFDPAADKAGYRLEQGGAGGAEPVAVLDTHDQAVRATGRILIEAGGALCLLQADGPAIVQPGPGAGLLAAELPEGPVAAALAGLAPLRALVPIGSGHMVARPFRLLDDEGKTLARGILRRFEGAKGARLTLTEVSALRGYEDSLVWLSGRFGSPGADFGSGALYDLLAPGLVPYQPKPPVPIGETETAFEAANHIIRTYLAVARENEAGVIADHDTEFLHDYRVALRKVRSVVSLFKGVYAEAETEALKSGFSGLMAATGRLRDLDVYLLERQRYFDLVPDSLHDGLEVMFDLFAEERAKTQQTLARRFRSKAYAAEIEALAARFTADGPAPGADADHLAHGYADALIWARYTKICKIARKIDDRTPDDTVHDLRIRMKKLRYLMEFFEPLYPAKDFKTVLRPLKRLQDTLGLFNDYSVQQLALHDLAEHHAPRGKAADLALARSIGALIAVLYQEQRAERGRVAARFAEFDSALMQRTFRRLFAAGEG